jgi:hypothetical protein
MSTQFWGLTSMISRKNSIPSRGRSCRGPVARLWVLRRLDDCGTLAWLWRSLLQLAGADTKTIRQYIYIYIIIYTIVYCISLHNIDIPQNSSKQIH